LGIQDYKIVRSKAEQVSRIEILHNENDVIVKDILDIDNQIKQKQITVKGLVLQMASNLEELYKLGDFQYPLNCIYSVITRNLENHGVSLGTRQWVWNIFATSENRKYMYSINEMATIDLDNAAKEAIKPELTELRNKVNDAFELLTNVEAKRDLTTRELLQHITIKVSELAPVLVDKCDKAGIPLPARTLKDEPVRIRKEDPQDNDLSGWLELLIEELTKVKDKFKEYRTADPEQMKWYCNGVKVHVQLLRSLSNDKWARNMWSWLGVIKQKVGQSNHSAQSMSGIWGQITGKRNLTREQIKAKTEMIIQFAQEFIEHSPGYWDMCYASTHLRENRIGDFHNDRHEKLSDSSIG